MKNEATLTVGTDAMPLPAKKKVQYKGRAPSAEALELREKMGYLKMGIIKFIASPPMQDAKARARYTTKMFDAAKRNGLKITTYTSDDNRIVATRSRVVPTPVES